MSIYVVILPDNTKISVEDSFPEKDWVKIKPGVWLVRKEGSVSKDVSNQLKIGRSDGMLGIVVSSDNFSGFASSDVVEKVKFWESHGE